MSIFYDFLEVSGGAERFTIEMANNLQQPIIVAGINQSVIKNLPDINVPLTNLTKMSSIPLWKSIKAMHAFKNIAPSLTEARVNLFSGNNSPLAIYHSQAQKNIYYCHTPPRFVYDLSNYYQKTLPWYQKKIITVYAEYVKSEYEASLTKMDAFYCNSINVQERMKKHLGYDAEVIYPPIDIDIYYNMPSQGYYLSTARLENYKRVELIVDAFLAMPDKKLIVVSGGSLFNKLTKKVFEAENIQIIGWVDEKTLLNYVAECIATIYLPIDEDFGMSPVESMAAGKPVIGVNDGGLKETVLHEQTGWLCPVSLEIEHIINAVNFMSINRADTMKVACRLQAEKFAPKIFHQRMNEIFYDR